MDAGASITKFSGFKKSLKARVRLEKCSATDQK
jgi:hypothetical protein